jgi:hypothetical protein
MTRFPDLLRILDQAGVEYIVVCGAAGTAHGSVRLTQDLDIVYRRSKQNIERIVTALAPLAPYPRGAPPGLPFKWDAITVRAGLNFTLNITLGAIDILGEIAGGGSYDQLLPHIVSLELYGVRCRCLDLDMLIHTKRAAGRPKDFDSIAELESIRNERKQSQ